ncbi:PREDICTED: coiled-coil domain-containing protein 137 [Ceratosolen solmsi marchali]|uniref:Coiled-coil domain-containing protein 137 n=1 Tax=Ceratosolen solmsi marchali TaxID=326594 RepID=A0AAJ6YRY9_9HYME|nr:PREDICTED: coiled-coil domain-containing protein 137 [Ceratosolen solmsi marchali]
MGRKIPGKKHKGVKNPYKQRAKRLSELKINDPPNNTDDQDIPKSLLRVIKLKNDVRNKSRVVKKKKKNNANLIAIGGDYNKQLPYNKGKPDKAVPVFNQKPHENLHQFWNRVNTETKAFIKETEFESKYNVEVKRNFTTGKIEAIEKKPKERFTELEKFKTKHKNISKKKKTVDDSSKLTKSQKRKQKLLKKKQEKYEDYVSDFKSFKDKIEFGDIVHAPPELKVRPRNSKEIDKVKNKNLLLHSILRDEKSLESKNTQILNKTGKRKDLPIGERRQIEKQQSDIVAAYRLLKVKQSLQSTIS